MYIQPSCVWPVWPSPCCPPDYELERLRRLREQAEREAEKERLRRWLREHGVDPSPSCPCQPIIRPRLPCGPLRVEDVLRQVR